MSEDRLDGSGRPVVHMSFAHQKVFAVFPDGTVEDGDHRVMDFGLDRFIKDIALGDCCFMCGVARDRVEFNDEHVIPNWILRKHRLHAEHVTLPNGRRLRYGSYTVPCCTDCNSRLGRTIEGPISAAFRDGASGLTKFFKTNGPGPLFAWMALLFVKTHLKDKTNPVNKDPRLGKETIGTQIAWHELHHAYCVARMILGYVDMQPEACGSIMILPARPGELRTEFDFADLTYAQTIMIRLESVIVIAVLNDACGAFSCLSAELVKLGPLSQFQYRELTASAAYINLQMKERPTFHTVLDQDSFQLHIMVTRPSVIEHKVHDKRLLGELVLHCWQGVIENLPQLNQEALKKAAIEDMGVTLWKEDGSFNDDFYMRDLPNGSSGSGG